MSTGCSGFFLVAFEKVNSMAYLLSVYFARSTNNKSLVNLSRHVHLWKFY